ncbi:enoyl-CoA hydratase/isomerase family protein [Pseudoclavibacter endophyticus]|uniref:Enoyl-CoA hydratase/isomerase family protein n=1 Tax=Pseudoclavibacter endophyticus TaxID=1778590 RepID=A0A6H9WR05_9MICO|nr:enoyl-CoA hydratase-related protein [Pseudoclavibacter endophyticus]KAB1650578.1 enoyl-CoA hydratase/isomerase family protein [Pseudoclavibacter endophyticus]
MIDVTIDGGVAEIVLNAPGKLNALGADDLRDLDAAYAEAEAAAAAGDVRALLLRGEGRGFCAGRDIAGVDPATDDVTGYLDGLVAPLMRRMSCFPAPTFAAVHGACLGVGLGLAIATDVVYVGERAKLGSPFANLGAALDSGGHALFVERLGAHRALDLIFTGELMSGAEAVAQGLFSRAVPDDELLEFTRERVGRAAQGATRAFVASKRLVAQVRDERLGLWASMVNESATQAELRDTADYREGFAAFQQKRTPAFRGR